MSEAARAKIVFVNRYFHPDESATSQLLSELAFELAAVGFDVHVVCSRQLYANAAAALAAHEIVCGVAVHRLGGTRFGRRHWVGRALDYLSFYGFCAVALGRILERGDVAVAKTDPPLISVLVAAIARRRRALLVNWLQDVFPEVASELGANPLPGALDRVLCRWRDASLRSARVNVVLGHRMREYLESRGVATERIRVIENWAVGQASEPTRADDSRLRRRLGLQAKFIVGYSGNLGRAHEYRIFFEAALALAADPKVEFLFVGGGTHREALEHLVRGRDLPNVRFLPYQSLDELPDSLAAANAHLVSLRPALEGLIVPSKFYGILAAGRPVVFVGDVDGELGRVIRESGCGVVIPSGATGELVAAIERLRDDPRLCESMGRAARVLLGARFDAAHARARWITLLESLRP